MQAVPAHAEICGDEIRITFNPAVSAIAKGQACVLYDKSDGHLLGGAFI